MNMDTEFNSVNMNDSFKELDPDSDNTIFSF